VITGSDVRVSIRPKKGGGVEARYDFSEEGRAAGHESGLQATELAVQQKSPNPTAIRPERGGNYDQSDVGNRQTSRTRWRVFADLADFYHRIDTY